MPKMKKSRLALAKEIETVCLEHAENIFNSPNSNVRLALEYKGYTFARYLDGELNEETSNEVRRMILDGKLPEDFSEALMNIEFMEELDQRGVVPDFVVKNEAGDYVAKIEATVYATIELLDKSIANEICIFAQAWEKDRPNLRKKLYSEFCEQLRELRMSADQFADVATMIEVYR